MIIILESERGNFWQVTLFLVLIECSAVQSWIFARSGFFPEY